MDKSERVADKEKTFLDQPHHAMRACIMHWDAFIKKDNERRQLIINKENAKLSKLHVEALEFFAANAKAEDKLKEI